LKKLSEISEKISKKILKKISRNVLRKISKNVSSENERDFEKRTFLSFFLFHNNMMMFLNTSSNHFNQYKEMSFRFSTIMKLMNISMIFDALINQRI